MSQEKTGGEKHKCGYCGNKSAYMCCNGCFPTIGEAKYAICNPSTGRNCYERHLAGEEPEYKMRKNKPQSSATEAATAEEQAEQEADNPDFAEQEAARRRRMDEEARQKIEADRQARRAARNADDDDDFDDDDYDVEVVYAPE